MILGACGATRAVFCVVVLMLIGCDGAPPTSTATESSRSSESTDSLPRKLDDSFQLIVKGNVTWKVFESSFDPANYRAAQVLLQDVVRASDAMHQDNVLAMNNLAIMLACNRQFSEARKLFERTLQAIDRGVKPDIEPIVLKMTVSNDAMSYTTWLSVLQANGGQQVTYKRVWTGDNYPNLFAHNNWYAYEVSDPPTERLRKLVRWNLSQTSYLETGLDDDKQQ
jgi:hypothetical protein